MSLTETKSNFEQLIDDRENGVIALSGKWGSGKSRMWRDVQRDSTNEAIKKALSVSLFGVKDIMQLKLRLVQAALPEPKRRNAFREVAAETMRQAVKLAKGINPAFSALDEVALLALPVLLRNSVIAVDDVERKHETLTIEEVMGFIDECRQMYGSRILLILNSDELKEKIIWDKLREKVIDHEIALETTPEEAFSIAIDNVPSPYAFHIQNATTKSAISNIRIIEKIIRMVNRILSTRPSLPDEVLQRIIPSTVLLSAIHFKGLSDGPNLDYVLNFGSVEYHFDLVVSKKPGDNSSDQRNLEVQWAQLMDELKIRHCGEYENVAVNFIKSGLLDIPKINSVLDRYVLEKKTFAVQENCHEFFEKDDWHPECTDAELLAFAETFISDIHLLDGFDISALHRRISQLSAGVAMGEKIVSDWLAYFEVAPLSDSECDKFLNSELHPSIAAKLMSHRRASYVAPSFTLFEACVRKSFVWEDSQDEMIKTATPKMFEAEIKRLTGNDLKKFMAAAMDLYANRNALQNQQRFGDGIWSFVGACCSLCHQNENPKLTKIIRLVFSISQIESLLEVYDCPRLGG